MIEVGPVQSSEITKEPRPRPKVSSCPGGMTRIFSNGRIRNDDGTTPRKVALYRVLKPSFKPQLVCRLWQPPAIACKDQAAVLGCSLSRIPSNTAM